MREREREGVRREKERVRERNGERVEPEELSYLWVGVVDGHHTVYAAELVG